MSIRIPKEVYRVLKEEKEETGESINEIITQKIKEGLERKNGNKDVCRR